MDRIDVTLNGEQKEVMLREGDAPEIFQYKGFVYNTTDTESFVVALKKFGDSYQTIIANKDDKMMAVIDHCQEGRQQSRVNLSWALSSEAKRWAGVLGKQLIQAQFVKFLEREARIGGSPVIENLLAQMKGLKINAQIIGDYSMDDRNNYTFMYKIGDLEGTSKIPALLTIEIPLLDGGRNETVDIEIEFIRPNNATDKPMFGLACPTWSDLLQQTIEYEVDKIRQEFPGWTLIKGSLW